MKKRATAGRPRGRPVAADAWEHARIAQLLIQNFGVKPGPAVRAAIGNDRVPEHYSEVVLQKLKTLRRQGASVPPGERSNWKLASDVLEHGHEAAPVRGYFAAAIRLAKKHRLPRS